MEGTLMCALVSGATILVCMEKNDPIEGGFNVLMSPLIFIIGAIPGSMMGGLIDIWGSNILKQCASYVAFGMFSGTITHNIIQKFRNE